MARKQYLIILACVLAVLAFVSVWRGYAKGILEHLSNLPANLLSRVSHIAQMVKSPALDFSEQEMNDIKRELEIEVIKEEPKGQEEPKEREKIEEKANQAAALPLPEPYTGISKEKLDWMKMNAMSKEITREAQVLSKQVERAEQGSEKAWDQSRLESEFEEIQQEALALKGELDEFSGSQSEIIEIQINLIQVLIQMRGLELAI